MRRLARNAQGVSSRGLRGVAFMWAILIAMPLMFFGMAMAVDFTRVIMAGREMSTAATGAALAGAYQFEAGKVTVNAVNARAAAVETMCVSQEERAIKIAAPADTGLIGCPYGGGAASMTVTLPTPSTVSVIVRYTVPHLLLLSYFSYGRVDQEVTRTAAVCDPRDAAGPTGGYCSRPTN